MCPRLKLELGEVVVVGDLEGVEAPAEQGLTLVHFSAQREHLL
jgi:hypothetical protein